ncbi:ribosome biogenesis/translation initiation ATPase RLI [Candidatus Micrarchaeota archaeon]|nr:ribosome biogenesis/translation initiation ATPase RLI [Candidatus Micrarchaeota archaeon]
MPKRIAVIDRDLCIKKKCGYACQKVCPVNRMGTECVSVEEDTGYPVISELTCIGCGLCAKKCPVSCIKIINLSKELGNPIYQYGINAFRLYGLPLPPKEISGAVSLVGKNGIGKTTALRILSSQLTPNLGELSKELSAEEMLELLNPDMKRYFTALNSELKVSTKPQYVNLLRDAFSGPVKELIKKMIPEDKREETVKKFELDKILDRDVRHLSGGELQKLSIAVAYSKEAEIYYFDEITNYLDIGERLNISVILKDFAENNKLILVDHDLTILDYVSDYVYVFYGEENAYGVVSGIKNVRGGINEYLKGYLSSENIRFRDHEILFSKYGAEEMKSKIRFKYSAMVKSFEGFNFESNEGDIRKGEIIGIVGKNALGKSLFVKMLAGVEKPDKGESVGFKVSYKPQYIEADDSLVGEILNPSKLKGFILEECKRVLNLNTLMEKRLNELSGGELQRVALTKALSTEADVYLFDEPSAFLDVDQRFQFAQLLRKVINDTEKSAFVVDHDIVFIDSIAGRIIPFLGESSVKGHAGPPLSKKDGMNEFLRIVGITMRRDKDTNRPRINKPESVLDREQKSLGDYYYVSKS